MRLRNLRRRTSVVMTFAAIAVALACGAACRRAPGPTARPIRIACKPFTESYVLSEIVAQIAEAAGEAPVERRFGMGGPSLVFESLRSGDIDLDVNYTGSIAQQFFHDKKDVPLALLRARLAKETLVLGEPLGFDNSYALAVRAADAERLGLHKVSDLAHHPELRGAFTPDFLNEEDGLYLLEKVYGFRLAKTTPMQHSLAYEAIASGQIDIMDAYTTDGTVDARHLVLLADDRGFFPKYLGVLVARADFPTLYPRTWAALEKLGGRISDERMRGMNRAVETRELTFVQAARRFLVDERLVAPVAANAPAGGLGWLWSSTLEHLSLVAIALALSCLVGIPLGVIAYRRRAVGHVVVALTGLLQTVPTLALLVFLIPLVGIGALPTVCALFLYGLLPIVQSTCTGLLAIDPQLIESARALRLTSAQRLRRVELPLASVAILGGVKTAAVINVATATIAALIGAGGYGRFITSGLAMNDMRTMLQGAIPTAVMAVAVHAGFEWAGRWVIPRGLRG